MLETATLTIDLKTLPEGNDGESNAQWVHLLPSGRFTARDGRGPWQVEDPNEVIENTRQYAGKNTLPIDYEHQTDLSAKNGKPAPAAGWLSGLKADEHGIWGLVNWTDKALEFLKAKEYRYLSPVITFRKDGRVVRVLRAALTNNPALEMTALAKAEDPEQTTSSGSELAEIKSLLGLDEEADRNELIESLKTLKAQANKDGYVPLGEYERVESEFGAYRQDIEEKTVLATVESAIEENLIPECLKDWGVSMCRHNAAGFEEFVNKVKGIYGLLYTRQTDRLTDEEKALLNAPRKTTPNNEIFTALGLSDDDITRYGE